MAVENLAPSSQHASCRPAAKICSGNPHLFTFPLKNHLHTIQNYYMPAPYAGHGPLLLALPQGAPSHSCFGTSDSENEGAVLFLDQIKQQGQLLPDLVTSQVCWAIVHISGSLVGTNQRELSLISHCWLVYQVSSPACTHGPWDSPCVGPKLLTARQTGDKYWKRLPSLSAQSCFSPPSQRLRIKTTILLEPSHLSCVPTEVLDKAQEDRACGCWKATRLGSVSVTLWCKRVPRSHHHLSSQEDRCPKGRKHVLQDIWYLLLSLQMAFNLRCIRSCDKKRYLCTKTWQKAAQQCRWKTLVMSSVPKECHTLGSSEGYQGRRKYPWSPEGKS